jgi:hypothetical protein
MKKLLLITSSAFLSYIIYIGIVFFNPSQPIFGAMTVGQASITAAAMGENFTLVPKFVLDFIVDLEFSNPKFRRDFLVAASHFAEKNKSYEALEKNLKFLISKGFDINENVSYVDVRPESKKLDASILYLQALSSSCEITKIYLKYGANPNRLIYFDGAPSITVVDSAEKMYFKKLSNINKNDVTINRLENMKCSLVAMKAAIQSTLTPV